MHAGRSLAALAAALLWAACESGGNPVGPGPDEPPDLGRNVSIEGTLSYDAILVPAGVTVTVTGPLTLASAGDITIAGTLAGDCVPITIDGDATLTVTGAIRNDCAALADDEPGPALLLTADGDVNFDGAVIETSGDLEIRNDPTLTEADFAAPPGGARAVAAARAAVGAGGRRVIVGIRNSTFIAKPAVARNGLNGRNGTDGRDGSNWRLLARGDFVLAGNNLIQGQSGGNGGTGTHAGAPADASGGDGGDGGRISVLATGQLIVAGPGANQIVSGSGGNGGSANAMAAAGPGARAPGATARGGDGGEPGLVRLEGEQGLSTDASLQVTVGNGGDGGEATAQAANGDPAVCVDGHGQHGGHADARGGNGGNSPDRTLTQSNVLLAADPVVLGGNGGRGGKATGRGGNGAPGRDCVDCRNGGDGGNLDAFGGDGGSALIRDLVGDLIGNGGDSGASEHSGGNGGMGSNCCSPTPTQGGHGGKGGSAAGGDGQPGTGLVNGAPGGVTIASGNGGNGGDGAPIGVGGDAGENNTVARGPFVPGTGHFVDGTDGSPCPTAGGVPGTSIPGNYLLSGALVSSSGPCSAGPGISNPNVVIEFDGTNVIINSTLRVVGPYDGTGPWTASATSAPNASGFRMRESFDGEWKIVDGVVVFEGTITFEILDPGGAVFCSSVYEVVFVKKTS